MAEARSRELAEKERKASKSAAKSKAAVSTPSRFTFKSKAVVSTPKRFTFKSVKRPLDGGAETGAGTKKVKVGNDKKDDEKTSGRFDASMWYSSTPKRGTDKDSKSKADEANAWLSKNVAKPKADVNAASALLDFRLVKKKFDIPHQTAKVDNKVKAASNIENLEAKVKNLEEKVKVANQKKKEKAEKEKREADHSKMKEKYKQLQETYKRLKKEEREVKLQRNIQNLAEKCKNLEEKLNDEKKQINVKTVGEVAKENVKPTPTRRRSKKAQDQKNRSKG